MVGKDPFGAATLQSNRTCTKYLLRSLPFLYNSKTHDTEQGTVRFALCIQCSYLFVPRLRTLLTTDDAHSRQKHMPFTGRAGAKVAGKEPTSDSSPVKGQLSVEPIEKLW